MNRRDLLRTLGVLGAGMIARPSFATSQLFRNTSLTWAEFGPDFQWGVATAAYQIEGAWDKDGKGPSIWDTFTHTKGKIKTGENGDTSCDFYNRYPDDLKLMADMAIPNYRFSIGWSRIFPEGTGQVNEKGLDFYDRLIDTCLELGIEPWLTCYHWDLPQALEDKGGWTNRDVVGWFTDYVDTITRRYGDRVSNWMVLNEPMAFTALGYFLGIHAPGKKGAGKFMPVAHHATMAQAEGGRVIRANLPKAQIGSTFSASHIQPVDDKPKNARAAARVDALLNRLYLEPALGMGYPMETLPFLKKMEKHIQPGDMEKLAFDFDFIGLQNYTREVVKRSLIPYVRATMIKPHKRDVPEEEITEMGWEVYPEGIYHLLKKFAAYPKVDKILVTENGTAFPDEVKGDSVPDAKRTAFIQDYLGQVRRAQKEGVNVQGYFVWTYLDNFEWAEGYEPRFGLVHVDFESQQRRIKDSGLWYRDFLKGK